MIYKRCNFNNLTLLYKYKIKINGTIYNICYVGIIGYYISIINTNKAFTIIIVNNNLKHYDYLESNTSYFFSKSQLCLNNKYDIFNNLNKINLDINNNKLKFNLINI